MGASLVRRQLTGLFLLSRGTQFQAEIHGVPASNESVQGRRVLVGVRRAGKPMKDKSRPQMANRLNFGTAPKSVDDYSDRIEELGEDPICSAGKVAMGSAICTTEEAAEASTSSDDETPQDLAGKSSDKTGIYFK